jgi:hypothetical protein
MEEVGRGLDDLVGDERGDDVGLVTEVLVEGAEADAGRPVDVLDRRGPVPDAHELLVRPEQQRRPRPFGLATERVQHARLAPATLAGLLGAAEDAAQLLVEGRSR